MPNFSEWLRFQLLKPMKTPEEDRRNAPEYVKPRPQKNYLCRICRMAGHWTDDCKYELEAWRMTTVQCPRCNSIQLYSKGSGKQMRCNVDKCSRSLTLRHEVIEWRTLAINATVGIGSDYLQSVRESRGWPVAIARSFGNSQTIRTNWSQRSANGDVQRATPKKQDVEITFGTWTVASQIMSKVELHVDRDKLTNHLPTLGEEQVYSSKDLHLQV